MGIVNVLTRQAHLLRDDHAYLEKLADDAYQRTCVADTSRERQFDRVALLGVPLPIRRRVVRQSLQKFIHNVQSPRFDIVDRILDRLEHGQSGWTIECKGVLVHQEYDRLIIRRCEENNSPKSEFSGMGVVPLPIPGEVVWSPTGQRITASRKSVTEIEGHVPALETHLDPSTFTPELSVRSWLPGDSFCPKGLGGRQKKLQNFFSDMKLPRSQRTKVPLLVAPEGILWVGGLRADERFQATPSTQSVVVAQMIL
jgi:tRNA(Ile)-lysidine synthase